MKNYMLRIILFSFLLLPLLAFAPPPVYTLKGKAVRIVDGDTFDLLVGTTTHRIRLAGIDAPEKGQNFGTASKLLLGKLCSNQILTVTVTNVDRNKRKIAEVYTEQKLWINKELIAKGMAWHFKKYSSDTQLANAELSARKQKVGLWSVKNPVAPWDWRKPKR
jgi:micrococcal nuclease